MLSECDRAQLNDRLVIFLGSVCSAPPEVAESIATEILSTYSSLDRHYHDLTHVRHCLRELDRLNGLNKAAIELAIWYHDLVYDSRSKTNEQDSADKMRAHLSPFAPEDLIREAAAMILASTHQTDQRGADPSLAAFLDIDMSVLGSSPGAYDEYARAVRREYPHVPAPVYAHLRKKLLKGVLARPIYYSAHFQKAYEHAARENISRELGEGIMRLVPPY